uniref:Uncharacterized protein n=1 Tax=Pandinus cavimanus TaxID=217261 RepID=H2CYQ5_PANCV|nr:hypothetical protein [Pandinus cavimanus]
MRCPLGTLTIWWGANERSSTEGSGSPLRGSGPGSAALRLALAVSKSGGFLCGLQYPDETDMLDGSDITFGAHNDQFCTETDLISDKYDPRAFR